MGSADGTLRVAVACSPRAGEAFEVDVELPAPACAWDAVRASGVLDRWPELATDQPSIGIWGRTTGAETALRDGDRVELYRSLAADPQEARRRRAREERRLRR
jgi:uncharacterized protein